MYTRPVFGDIHKTNQKLSISVSFKSSQVVLALIFVSHRGFYGDKLTHCPLTHTSNH